jgi:hypothetical protein
MTMTALDALDSIAATAFEGYLVRKDLVRKYARQYPVPTYVVEFLLGRYCASTDEREIQEGLEIVEKQFAQIILGYKTRVKSLAAKLAECRHGVARRAAARHFAFIHIDDLHQFDLAFFVYKGHHPFFDPVLLEEIVIYFSDNVDNSISDPVDVVFFTHSLQIKSCKDRKKT